MADEKREPVERDNLIDEVQRFQDGAATEDGSATAFPAEALLGGWPDLGIPNAEDDVVASVKRIVAVPDELRRLLATKPWARAPYTLKSCITSLRYWILTYEHNRTSRLARRLLHQLEPTPVKFADGQPPLGEMVALGYSHTGTRTQLNAVKDKVAGVADKVVKRYLLQMQLQSQPTAAAQESSYSATAAGAFLDHFGGPRGGRDDGIDEDAVWEKSTEVMYEESLVRRVLKVASGADMECVEGIPKKLLEQLIQVDLLWQAKQFRVLAMKGLFSGEHIAELQRSIRDIYPIMSPGIGRDWIMNRVNSGPLSLARSYVSHIFGSGGCNLEDKLPGLDVLLVYVGGVYDADGVSVPDGMSDKDREKVQTVIYDIVSAYEELLS